MHGYAAAARSRSRRRAIARASLIGGAGLATVAVIGGAAVLYEPTDSNSIAPAGQTDPTDPAPQQSLECKSEQISGQYVFPADSPGAPTALAAVRGYANNYADPPFDLVPSGSTESSTEWQWLTDDGAVQAIIRVDGTSSTGWKLISASSCTD
jgi:hypothetical protein